MRNLIPLSLVIFVALQWLACITPPVRVSSALSATAELELVQ